MKNKTITYRIKKGARTAAQGISTSFMIFIVLIILSISFILFQLKEFQIAQDFKDIQKLKNEIEELESLNHRYKSKIDNELATYSLIHKLANELGLKEALEQPKILNINKDRLKKYVEKDKKISQ